MLRTDHYPFCWGCSVGTDGLGFDWRFEGDTLHAEHVVREQFQGAPGMAHGGIVAALLDAFEVVLLHPPTGASAIARRRLAARVRERGRALIVLTPAGPLTDWSFDVRLTGTTGVWEGLGWGFGHLRSRQLQVRAEGRRLAGRTRHATVWLPDADGRITVGGVSGRAPDVRLVEASA